ncbi:hypothetical protein [Gordonia sp. NPDC127522]|uniref:hypothetical protein n=1 Tax=Gordonia sp. NPDC127522 TaxID=3345390 RepID=UPI0036424B7C
MKFNALRPIAKLSVVVVAVITIALAAWAMESSDKRTTAQAAPALSTADQMVLLQMTAKRFYQSAYSGNAQDVYTLLTSRCQMKTPLDALTEAIPSAPLTDPADWKYFTEPVGKRVSPAIVTPFSRDKVEGKETQWSLVGNTWRIDTC